MHHLTPLSVVFTAMASFPHNLLFSSLVIFFFALSQAAQVKLPPPNALILPIRKDTKTLQYYTTIEISARGSYVNAVLDLGGETLWFNCEGYHLATYRPIECDSAKCEAAKGSGCMGCDGPAKPGCTNNTCGSYSWSPFSGINLGTGFGEEFMYGTSTDGRRLLQKYKSPNPSIFSCADYPDLYEGLASQAKGLIGLSRASTGLQTQFATAFKLAHKFSLCLPSSIVSGSGSIFIGGGPYFMPPNANTDLSQALFTTPLLINPVSTAPVYSEGDPSDEYFLDVKSIKIDDEPVSFKDSLLSFDKNGVGGSKISTTVPYTVLHSSILKPFVRAFEKAASNKMIKKVADVAPFEACFDSNTIAKTTLAGPDVPIINIVLEGKNAEWKIYGDNSMVEVTKGVSCLAFVDGGKEPRTSIVLGGHQLENYLLEFDLASSKLGFTSSLLLLNTTCSQTRESSSTWTS